jgi:hypothetical protein
MTTVPRREGPNLHSVGKKVSTSVRKIIVGACLEKKLLELHFFVAKTLTIWLTHRRFELQPK